MAQVDRINGLIGTLGYKAPCRVATTANITLSGTQTIDGVTVVAEDRVLVRNQTAGADNGIWVVGAATWQRAPDFDGALDVVTGTQVRITSGTNFAGYVFSVATTGEIIIGATSLTFSGLSPDGGSFRDVIFLTSADSPYTVTQAQSGKLLSVNTSGGAVTINLPTISSVALPFLLGVKKASGASTVTVNRGGTDTFDDGSTSLTVSQGATLIPDTDQAPDTWTIVDWSVPAATLQASGGSALVGFVQAGTGAVLRTVQAKLRDQWVSVKDFGAVGDDSTDDTTAIQAAIDAAGAAGGGSVYFPRGGYRITSGLTVTTDDVVLRGDGRLESRIVVNASVATALLFDGSALGPGYSQGCGFVDMGLIYNVAPSAGQVTVKLLSVNQFMMRNFNLSSVKNGIVIGAVGKQPNRVWIEQGTISGDGEQVGIDLVDCVNIFMSDLTLNGGSVAGSVAIRCNSLTGVTGSVEDIWMERILTEAWAYGLRIGGSGGTGMANWFISDCVFDGTFEFGLYCELQTPGSWQQVNIVNTHFAGITGSGTAVGIIFAVGGTPQRIHFTGCRIQDYRAEGIRLSNLNAKNIQFDACDILNCSSAGASSAAGVLIDANVDEWAVRGCRVDGTNHSYAINVAGTTSNYSIVGCDLRNSVNAGINLGSAPDASVAIIGNTPASSTANSGSWTPTVTFTTPGDVAVVYSARVGIWEREGNTVTATFDVATSTFTHTTAAGSLVVTGFPFTSKNVTDLHSYGAVLWSGITKAGYSAIAAQLAANQSQIAFIASGSGVASAAVAVADVPSGGTVILRGTITYFI